MKLDVSGAGTAFATDTRSSPVPAVADGRLDGWKAIAAYLGRTVRTVQRWEREQQLPVCRLNHNTLSSVYAFTGDIDGWRRRRSNRSSGVSNALLWVSLSIGDLTADGNGAPLCRSLRHHVATALKRLPMCRLRYVGSEASTGAPDAVPRRTGEQVVLCLAIECASRELMSISAQLTRNDGRGPVWFERIEDQSVFGLRQRVAQAVVSAVRRQVVHASRRLP